jgi:osmotically-inducible protein OsmY
MADRYDDDRGYEFDRDRARAERMREHSVRNEDRDRGFAQRAGDEVRSWFGDDEAARRRQLDERHDRVLNYGRSAYDGERGRDYGRERGFGSPDYGGESRSYGSYGYESGVSRSFADRDDNQRSRTDVYGAGRGWGESRGYGRYYGEGNRPYSASRYDRGIGQDQWSSNSYNPPRSQPTMGNPDWDRTSSIYGSGNQGWGPAAQGYDRDWSHRREPNESRAKWNGWPDDSNRRSAGNSEAGPYSGRGPRGYQRSDDRIREDICDRLTRHGEIDATDVQISVRGGEVTLDGAVDTRHAKRLAEDVAESVDGVRDVTNHLKASRGWSSDRQEQRSPSDAGLGNPGTPSTLGLTSGSAGQTGTSAAPEKKR